MNSTEKHKMRERRRISAQYKRALRSMNRSMDAIMAAIAQKFAPATIRAFDSMADCAKAYNEFAKACDKLK